MPTPLNIKLKVIAALLLIAIMGTTAAIGLWDLWHEDEKLPPCACVCTNS